MTPRISIRLVVMAGLALFLCPLAGKGEEKPAPVQLFETGLGYQQQATQAQSADAMRLALQKAIENFRAATELEGNFFAAHHQWAVCLVAMSARAESHEEYVQLTKQARERFAFAAGCAGVQPVLYENWGSFLMTRVDDVATAPEARFSILTEAREAFEKGLKSVSTDPDRARFDGLLAQCFVKLVLYTPYPDEREEMFRLATKHFEAATRDPVVGRYPGLYASWGLTLFKLGQFKNDSRLIREGVDRMRTGLSKVENEADPASLALHYNMACALTSLSELDEALQHLKFILQRDATGGYLTTAQNDSDLQVLRATSGYQQLVASKSPAPVVAVTTDTPESRARAFTEAGAEMQERAAGVGDPAGRERLLVQAVENYRQATELKTDLYLAHVLWAQCLTQLEGISAAVEMRKQLSHRVRERYAAAAGCADADVGVFVAWGSYVVGHVTAIGQVSEEDRLALDEARGALEKGLRAARFTGQTAEVHGLMGLCYVLMGNAESKPDRKLELFEQAAEHFQQSAKVERFAKNARQNSAWGVALVRIGGLTKQKLQLRMAVERLQMALLDKPNDPLTNYNMACAFALMRDPDAAMRHLQICLKQDSKGEYYRSAESDPDLAFIRSSNAYREVFRPGVPFDTLTRPTVSGQ